MAQEGQLIPNLQTFQAFDYVISNGVHSLQDFWSSLTTC